jgi:methyl-accepting chemotaxis protein
LAIVLLFPNEAPNVLEQSQVIEKRLDTATKGLSTSIDMEWLQDSPTYFTPELKEKFTSLLGAEEWISQADIYVSDLTGRQVLVYRYGILPDSSERVNMKPLGLALKTESTGSVIGPVFAGGNFLVYYYPFLISKRNQAFLSTAVNHDMIVSDRGQIRQALLLIFLGATLISLFTVYLVMKWFHAPLSKLIQRLSKTTEGGIYYQLETEGDEESAKLTKAFNLMSAQLYDNKRELEEFQRSQQTNRSLVTSKSFCRPDK